MLSSMLHRKLLKRGYNYGENFAIYIYKQSICECVLFISQNVPFIGYNASFFKFFAQMTAT